MIKRILDDNKRGAPQERTQCQCEFGAKPLRHVRNIPLLLEVFAEFRGFFPPVQRIRHKKRGPPFGVGPLGCLVEDEPVRKLSEHRGAWSERSGTGTASHTGCW